MIKGGYVYFMTNKHKNVLYVGVTSNMEQRLWQHKLKSVEGFTRKYNVEHLVYVENFPSIEEAIAREKQIKNWSRKNKDFLVNQQNPIWLDISVQWYEGDPSTTLGMTKKESMTV